MTAPNSAITSSGHMNWQSLLGALTVGRLRKLARNVGLVGLGRKRKAQLVAALLDVLDEALKREALLLMRADELRRWVTRLGMVVSDALRHRDLIQLLLSQDRAESSHELDEQDLLVLDRGRLDVPPGEPFTRGVQPLPSRPQHPDLLLFFEVQELMRRPHLSRAVLAAPRCDSALLQRLLGEGLDDLIESAARLPAPTGDEHATVSVVLSERASLDSDAGRSLVALAQQLEGRLEIRLLHASQRLTSSVLAFEEMLAGGPHLTTIVGSPPRSLDAGAAGNEIAAHVRLAAPTDAAATPSGVLKEWLRHLLQSSVALTDPALKQLSGEPWVADKVRYKLRFDTAHELRLKHLAEHICRRGREGLPPFDPSTVEPLLAHQRRHLVRAARPGRRGVMLCDDSGAGKTVTAAFIVARELRRARVLVSQRDVLARRALVVAPQSLHRGWCEEFSAKLGLAASCIPSGVTAAQLSDPSAGRRITICTPSTVREHWESLQGFEIVAVAEAHLFEQRALAAVAGIAKAAQFCVVTSSHPAQHDIADMFALAELVAPQWRFDTLSEFAPDDDHLRDELRAIAVRTQRTQLLQQQLVVTRQWLDRHVTLSDDRAAAYRALRQLRFDYQARGNRTTAWAFIALERAFLSSLAAFRSALSWTLATPAAPAALHECFAEHGDSDGSLSFLRSSGYYQRRLRDIDNLMAPALASAVAVGAKEAALLATLREHVGQVVVVFCSFRATQQRLASVLAQRQHVGPVDIIDGSSSPRERMAVIARCTAALRDHSPKDGATGVLLCTDEAAAGLRLSSYAAAGINYDIPDNPQTIEWRIRRLHCLGQKQPVRFTSLAQRDPAPDGWTMDTRVIHCCRQLFDIAPVLIC
ncbi:MAG TPA: hypothetical protein ENK23_03430 [Sorangium sp.]|nr:hypothetical protein [Sorangium sp.]